MHDFIDKGLGKPIPYGVYDIAANTACVSMGIDNDTALFFVNSSSRRLQLLGRERYPDMQQLTITADGGGSNGSRVGCSRSNSRNWRTKPVSRFRSAITRQGLRNGSVCRRILPGTPRCLGDAQY